MSLKDTGKSTNAVLKFGMICSISRNCVVQLLRLDDFKGSSSMRISTQSEHLPWLRLCIGLV